MSLNDEEPKTGNTQKKLALCQECREKEILYQCPRCYRRTCSLACCRSHKATSGCTGKRDVTAFLPIGSMTDATVASDFHFLEDIVGRVDAGKRLLRSMGGNSSSSSADHRGKRPRRHLHDDNKNSGGGETNDHEVPPQQHPHPMLQAVANSESFKLHRILPQQQQQQTTTTGGVVTHHSNAGRQNYFQQKAAAAGVNVLVLPSAMERHQVNTSNVVKKKNGGGVQLLLHWTVELVWMYNNDNGETAPLQNDPTRRPTATVLLHNIPETSLVSEVVALHHHRQMMKTPAPAPPRLDESSSATAEASYSVLLKKLPCPSNRPIYVEILLTSPATAAAAAMIATPTTIADALRDMTVVEFPTFYVVPRNRLAGFSRAFEEVVTKGES